MHAAVRCHALACTHAHATRQPRSSLTRDLLEAPAQQPAFLVELPALQRRVARRVDLAVHAGHVAGQRHLHLQPRRRLVGRHVAPQPQPHERLQEGGGVKSMQAGGSKRQRAAGGVSAARRATRGTTHQPGPHSACGAARGQQTAALPGRAARHGARLVVRRRVALRVDGEPEGQAQPVAGAVVDERKLAVWRDQADGALCVKGLQVGDLAGGAGQRVSV